MIKWRCEVCKAQRQSEVKPDKIKRLCEDCAAQHWRRVVDIYTPGGGDNLAEAKRQLVWAISRLKEYQSKAGGK
jgi:hypothetical protein